MRPPSGLNLCPQHGLGGDLTVLQIEVEASEATIYLWIKVPAGHTDESYAQSLLRQGILLSPGRMFAVSEAGGDYVRLALVPSMEQCREAIALWRQVAQGEAV